MFDEDARDDVRNRRSIKPRLRARCPECDSWVPLKDSVELWDLVICPHCNTTLEVIDMRPPKLDFAGQGWDEEEEEWEDEEDYYN